MSCPRRFPFPMPNWPHFGWPVFVGFLFTFGLAYAPSRIVAQDAIARATVEGEPAEVQAEEFRMPSLSATDSIDETLQRLTEVARQSNQPILFTFLGDLERTPCRLFQQELLTNPSYIHTIQQNAHMVLLSDSYELDNVPSVDDPETIRMLLEHYEIRGLPAILMTDSEGRPIGKSIGFGRESANEAYQVFGDMLQKHNDVAQLRSRAERLLGAERAIALHQSLELLPRRWVMSRYRDIVEEIIAIDHSNDLMLRIEYELGIIQHDARKDSLVEAVAQTETLLERVKMTASERQRVNFTRASLLYDLDKDASLAAFRQAYQDSPSSPLAERIRAVLKRAFEDAE